MKNIKNVLKWIVILIAGIAGGILGALSGQGAPKILRRLGITAILTVLALLFIHNLWVLTVATMFAVFTLGYGIPDKNDTKPSLLGKIALAWANDNSVYANVIVKSILAVLTQFCLLSIPIIKGNWGTYIISFGICLVGYVLFGGLFPNWGTIKAGKYELLIEEILRYFTVTAAGAVLIMF